MNLHLIELLRTSQRTAWGSTAHAYVACMHGRCPSAGTQVGAGASSRMTLIEGNKPSWTVRSPRRNLNYHGIPRPMLNAEEEIPVSMESWTSKWWQPWPSHDAAGWHFHLQDEKPSGSWMEETASCFPFPHLCNPCWKKRLLQTSPASSGNKSNILWYKSSVTGKWFPKLLSNSVASLYYVWLLWILLWIIVQLSVNQSNSLYLVEQNGFQNTLTTTSCTFIVVNDIKELIH